MPYDIIGDVHGHAGRLEALLRVMDYEKHASGWRHAERIAVFVGDLIDRGPEQVETLILVRDMVEAGAARIAMGNHELNAIAYATPDPDAPGQHLRPRTAKNAHQHKAFIDAVGLDTPLHREWTDWFRTLPLWIDEANFRVVHACWHPQSVAVLEPLLNDRRLTDEVIVAGHRKDSPEYRALETLLKGPEIELPDGYGFIDKDGHDRHAVRARWWLGAPETYRDAYIGPDDVVIPDLPLPPGAVFATPDRPVFIGHYWLNPKNPPAPLTDKVACVDFSVARGGPMMAYRFDGETQLAASKFVSA